MCLIKCNLANSSQSKCFYIQLCYYSFPRGIPESSGLEPVSRHVRSNWLHFPPHRVIMMTKSFWITETDSYFCWSVCNLAILSGIRYTCSGFCCCLFSHCGHAEAIEGDGGRAVLLRSAMQWLLMIVNKLFFVWSFFCQNDDNRQLCKPNFRQSISCFFGFEMSSWYEVVFASTYIYFFLKAAAAAAIFPPSSSFFRTVFFRSVAAARLPRQGKLGFFSFVGYCKYYKTVYCLIYIQIPWKVMSLKVQYISLV